jgi:hypothetical protein
MNTPGTTNCWHPQDVNQTAKIHLKVDFFLFKLNIIF